jgi:alpha-tubulin suppressor-like RCC1 family protein
VKAGHNQNIALSLAGEMTAWGNLNYEQWDIPTGVFSAVAPATYHNCAMDLVGSITCWGWDEYGQVTDVPAGEFSALDANGYTSCALDAAGQVSCLCAGQPGED